MADPKVAQPGPYILDMQPGHYSWCTCGESQQQPFCDHTHRVAGQFKSLKVDLTVAKKVAWCGCKRTKNPPYCDGSHAKV